MRWPVGVILVTAELLSQTSVGMCVIGLEFFMG